jgi:hypothetical protein
MSFFYFLRKIEKLIVMNYDTSQTPQKMSRYIHKLLEQRNIRRYIVKFRDFNIKFCDLYINFIDTVYNCCQLSLWIRLCEIDPDFAFYAQSRKIDDYFHLGHIVMMKGFKLFQKQEYNYMFYYFILCNKQIKQPINIDLIREIYKFYGFHKIYVKIEQKMIYQDFFLIYSSNIL